ncbi:MAG TPA: transporter [Gemmatimonadaceae bacterium]|nr:transporter [Gemmatimonadaceae bacterium]
MRRRATLVPLLLAALILAFPTVARAQGLQGKISELFIFGPGEEPLFLAGTADPNNPTAIRVHGRHFVPAAATENGSIIDFITSAISANISNVPIGSTGGGETFHFEGGVPVKTSTSAGPIFGERGQTIGRGRVLAGLSRSGFHFTSLRGVDLHDIALNFTHENVNFEGCSEAQGADCALMGVPNLENDVIQFRLSLDIDVRVTSLYLTYGIADRVDVAAVIPVVETSMRGRSDAQVVPFGGPTATHFFAGTPTNPVLAASRTSDGSSFGLGDVALRLKTNVHETPRTSVALLADARLPTGAKDDLLGSGTFAARGLAIVSTRVGDLSPHVNVGYFFRAGDTQNDAVLATLGFDDRLVGIVTLAADLVSELQVGQSHLTLPQPVTYDAPFHRVVQPTSIPDTRDDIINGSFGIKIGGGSGAIGVLNALFPLNRGGMRPNVVYTAGLEYSF